MIFLNKKIFSFLFLFCFFAGFSFAKDYSVGVYYYPGWKDVPADGQADPWKRIKRAGIEPLLGFYPEGDDKVVDTQMRWMAKYGIDYVIYDWYWRAGKGVKLSHAIDAYGRLPDRHGVRFSIMWANHSDEPSSLADFDEMVKYWVDKYFLDESYLKNNGMPVVFVFDPKRLEKNSALFGSNTEELFRRAQSYVKTRGLPGIYFVGGSQAINFDVKKLLPTAGYSAISAYNYHVGYSGEMDRSRRFSRSYSELTDGYMQSWRWILENSSLPYFLPLSSGWDKRPWGGSTDPLHDLSISDAAEFKAHLQKGKDMLNKYNGKSDGVVICCWNEYGEGSYIEPTKKYGFQYLEAVRDIFGNK
ncbi:glycoside hydrolase family 99-like domain-containing protein [Variovorax ginsengisoli]|uniref:Glycosyltransferase WbsX n=1 Tax=Variovorax ginsengisoli TaxID=363844 RepID=A0ABT9SCZ4_9BURK|nr:glycoside hydrolase family 99-like domain-containing protein [Variovorax ginsengisoli]MDP9902214.1 hypothetical protein [Variovorax ginsengisoli]